jgi:hypothetical protein
MLFQLTDEQVEQTEKWKEEREKYVGAIGGQFGYIFIPTSLGHIMKIKCYATEEELDLTDYSDW